MPTTALALLLFVVLLAPGFVYTLQRELDIPEREVSVFRETTSVALASVATNLVVIGAFAILRTLLPTHTPDVGELVRDTRSYVDREYDQLAIWTLGLLVAAASLAYCSARLFS